MKPILLTQRIISPEKVWEFPVFAEPSVWYRGPLPTSVIPEGDIPEECLRRLIDYAAMFGWRWDDVMKRFYPTE